MIWKARGLRRAAVAVGVALLALAGIAAPASASPESPHTSGPPTVLVGIAGLHWTDVDPSNTPTLWRMVGSGSVGSVSGLRVKTSVSCTLDAWLTLSSGHNTTAARPDESEPTGPDTDSDAGTGAALQSCPNLPAVTTVGTGIGPATVENWAGLVPTGAMTAQTSSPGLLGDLFAGSDQCALAVGPGAAVMLADSQGRVDRYSADLRSLSTKDLTACGTAVVDAGTLPDSATQRNTALRQFDDTLARLTSRLPSGSRILVAGIVDTPLSQPGFQVVADWTSPGHAARWESSASTRRAGIVLLTDLTATVADDAGLDTPQLGGSVLRPGELRHISTSRTVENRSYLSVLSSTISTMTPALLSILAAAEIIAIGWLLVSRRLAWRRIARLDPATAERPNGAHRHRWGRRRPQTERPASPDAARETASSRPSTTGSPSAEPQAQLPGRWGRRLLAATLLVCACAPIGANLASLSRWWAQPSPTFTLVASLAVATVVVAIAAWALARLLPQRPWRLALTASGLTWLILTIDGVTGTTLQQGSLLGSNPETGGRFYGFNNMTFAVYGTAAIVLAAAIASWLTERGHRRAAVAAVVAVGVVTTLTDGWPEFGADFGGILSFVPAFAILALLVARVRVTFRRVLVVAGSTIVVVVAVSVIDWLTGPVSHLGRFVQEIVDGDGWPVIMGKAEGAWGTVANPGGFLTLIAIVVIIVLVLKPRRLPEVRAAYRAWPLLRGTVVVLVTAAAVGSVTNDSGLIVAIVFALVSLAMLVATFLDAPPLPASGPPASAADAAKAQPVAVGTADSSVGAADRPVGTAGRPAGAKNAVTGPVRSMPAMIAALGGGLLIVLLLASTVPNSVWLRSDRATATAGDEVHPTKADEVSNDGSLVVIGMTGLQWSDVTAEQTPTLRSLIGDGAGTAGMSEPTGAAARCTAGGWMAMSAGSLTQTADSRWRGAWDCPPARAIPTGDGGATVYDWSKLTALQHGSSYKSSLGELGDALAADTEDPESAGTAARGAAPSCATAVGPGAAVALARSDGTVSRYRTLLQALQEGTDAFDCAVTVVDVGDATPVRRADLSPTLTSDEVETAQTESHTAKVKKIDQSIRKVIDAAPANATIVIASTAGYPSALPVLGVGIVQPGLDGPEQARFITSAATKTDGVARVLDLPSTILDAAGKAVPTTIGDSPLAYGSPRPADTTTTIGELTNLTTRDQERRSVYGWFTTNPLYAGLLLAAGCLVAGLWAARRGPLPRPAFAAARAGAYIISAVSIGAFLVTLSSWWLFPNEGLALALSAIGATLIAASLGSLAPRAPIWLGPGIIAGLTFVVLTFDGLLGTPLNRVSPLGSAPTYGARFYGFGNPTFSVYAICALLFAAALAQWLLRRGHRWWAAGSVVAIGVVTMLVDVWPTLGADLGGGLVLVPGFAVLAIAAAGWRITWRRVIAVGILGVALVAGISFVDWLRPPAARTHLGDFFNQLIHGDAFGMIARKASYALRSVLGGVPVWLTLVVLILAALALFAPRRFTPRWFARCEESWPLIRPMLLAWWLVSLGGSLVNDFGLRIAMVALIPAVPLLVGVAINALQGELDGKSAEPAVTRTIGQEESDASAGAAGTGTGSGEPAESGEPPGEPA